MKKVTILIFALLISSSVFSQGLDLGIKAGLNFSSLTDAQGLSNKTGFVAGVFAGVKFSDKIGLQADLLYSQQGAEFDAGSFDLTYVNIPVVLKYYLFKGLNLQGGAQFGFNVADDISTVIGDVETQVKAESFDLSGVVGLGFDLPIGIRVDGRYNFGLTEVVKSDINTPKNTVITLSVGYSFL
jgi:hypothetical protein